MGIVDSARGRDQEMAVGFPVPHGVSTLLVYSIAATEDCSGYTHLEVFSRSVCSDQPSGEKSLHPEMAEPDGFLLSVFSRSTARGQAYLVRSIARPSVLQIVRSNKDYQTISVFLIAAHLVILSHDAGFILVDINIFINFILPITINNDTGNPLLHRPCGSVLYLPCLAQSRSFPGSSPGHTGHALQSLPAQTPVTPARMNFRVHMAISDTPALPRFRHSYPLFAGCRWPMLGDIGVLH